MARIAITGAGMNGLTAALLLAADGHEVEVLERDPAPPPPPSEAWDAWDRRSVGQFRQLHYLMPRWRHLVEAELPAIADALDGAGAVRFDLVGALPEVVRGERQPGDEDLVALTARRPVLEAAVAGVVAATPGITVRRGVALAGVDAVPGAGTGVPHVQGVVTETGEVVAADVVVDASGRRSALPAWLAAAGARPLVEEEEDLGFVYYGRHFRSPDGSLPPVLGPLLIPVGSFSILTLPADNGTWGVGIIASARDADLRAVRDDDTWMRVVRACPPVAHWVDAEPLDDVAVMARLPDRRRHLVVDGEPVVTGLLPLGDVVACTNPSLGRGIAMGAMHAIALRDALRSHDLADADKLALAWHEITERTLGEWYRSTVAFDRHRLAEIDATIDGEPYDPGDPQWEITRALMHAASQDVDVLRAYLRISSMLAPPEEALAGEGILERVIELGADWRSAPPNGPDRAELRALLSR